MVNRKCEKTPFFRDTTDKHLLGPRHRNGVPGGSNCFVLEENLLSFLRDMGESIP
jgi:hypothetical protein